MYKTYSKIVLLITLNRCKNIVEEDFKTIIGNVLKLNNKVSIE